MDIMIFICVFAIGFFPMWRYKNSGAESFAIIHNGQNVAEISADADTIILIEAELGDVKVRISNRSASVIESNCPHRICIKSGKISSAGQAVVCIPNGLIVVAKGYERRREYDAILR